MIYKFNYLAVPKRFKFKTTKLHYKKINNNSTFIILFKNTNICKKLTKYL